MSQATLPQPGLRTAAGAPAVHRAFRRYAGEVLAGIVATARLRHADWSVRVDGFRLRSYHENTPVWALPSIVDTMSVTGLLNALLRVLVPRVDGQTCSRARWSARAEHGSWAVPEDGTGDFVFAYPVPPSDAFAPRLPEFCAAVLWALLDTVDLTYAGQPVAVDEIVVGGQALRRPGIRTTPADLGPRQEIPGSGRQPLHTVAATEPTIVTLARHWSLLAPLLTVTPVAAPVGRIDAFELRDLSGWLVETDCHPRRSTGTWPAPPTTS
jgi:hypothetical protein